MNRPLKSAVAVSVSLLTFSLAGSVIAQPVQWTQRLAGGILPRTDHRMVYDSARGVIVMFGGTTTGSDYKGDTWEWDGVSWTVRAVSGPSPRIDYGMAYDVARGVTVLFGGYVGDGNSASNETWEWNDNSWTQRAVSGPPARWHHAMAYDATRGVTVLFGGLGYPNGTQTFLGDTWEWNGTVWTWRSDTGPAPRWTHSMSYDLARHESVMFGGSNTSYANLSDTWAWNGSTWTLRSQSGPTARTETAMVFDTSRGVTVLFGGHNSAGFPDGETWEWDGTIWTQQTISGPSPRYGHAMAYDVGRRMSVLFGGYSVSGFSSETWGLAPAAPIITSQPVSQSTCPSGSVAFAVAANSVAPPTYSWQWQIAGDSSWQTIVNGTNSAGGIEQFVAIGASTPHVSIRPPIGPTGTRIWQNPSYNVYAVVSNIYGAANSNQATLSICNADFNCDGRVDFFDYLDFVDAFSSSLPDADFNQDGGIDFFDYLDFVDAFSIGC